MRWCAPVRGGIAEDQGRGDPYGRARPSPETCTLMQMPDGRRVFLKELAALAGGLWTMPQLTRTGADAGHGGRGAGLASPAVAPRRPDAFTRLPLKDVRLGGRLGTAI